MLRSLGLEVVKIRDVHPLVQVVVLIIALLVALALTSIFILLSGADPIEAFTVMFKGAFGGRRQILETLLRASPLLLTGLATVITFRAEIWSIGQEGQLFGGAMAAFYVYQQFGEVLPRPLLLLVIVLAGFAGGAILGAISGMMKAWANVDVIISTVMLNFIVISVLSTLLYDHKYWMGESTYYPRTDAVAEASFYPTLFEGSRFHMGFLIALGLAILIAWVLKRTPYGYDIRALGANPIATRFQGINVSRLIIVTMLVSGGIAGLAGAGEVFGVHHNVAMDISPGYGYTGIIVAMVAELNPLVTILVAILFGGLINGSVILITSVGTHTSIIFVIQAIVLLCVLTGRALMKYRIRRISYAD